MDYKTWILEKLLTKYEESKAFRSGVFSRRIAIDVKKESALLEVLEYIEEKRIFLSVLDRLKEEGLIEYSWEKYEMGNLVERIWLVPEEKAVAKCYESLKRIPKKEAAQILQEQIKHCQSGLGKDTALYCFFDEMLADLAQKHRIPRFFTEDAHRNGEILQGLFYMEQNSGEWMERLFSSWLYGDSKYFEKYVKTKAVSVLRHIKKKESQESFEDEDLLREKGIVRWPEILEFTGKVTAVLEDGTALDFSGHKYGAYVNSETVKKVKEVIPKEIRQITFIENKANYIWYLSHRKKEDELVVFHGGFYSPVKGMWFKKLYEGSQKQKHKVSYAHWSDIDAGGFQLYVRLKKQIVKELWPYQMGKEALLAFKESAVKIKTDSYRSLLKSMENNPDYQEFQEVIQTMLALDIRLEQEAMIAEKIVSNLESAL